MNFKCADDEKLLLVKDKPDHTLIVTTKRLYIERDGKATPLCIDGSPHFREVGHA